MQVVLQFHFGSEVWEYAAILSEWDKGLGPHLFQTVYNVQPGLHPHFLRRGFAPNNTECQTPLMDFSLLSSRILQNATGGQCLPAAHRGILSGNKRDQTSHWIG